MPKNHHAHSEAAQVGRFGLVGILNTVVDFVVQFLLFKLVGLSSSVAAVLSGTVAMTVSFFFNQRFTFRRQHSSTAKIVLFFVITAFGIWVLRPIIITIFVHYWTWPSHTAYDIVLKLKLDQLPGVHSLLYTGKKTAQEVVANELALVMAIIIVLFYNYVAYKRYVFNE